MGELIVDLKQSLMHPDEDFVKVIDPDEEASTRMITDKDMAQIKRQSDRRDSMDEAMRLRRNDEYYRDEYEDEDEEDDEDIDDEDIDDDDEYYRDDYEDEDDDDDYDPKMENITTILAVVAALLVGGIIIFVVGNYFGIFPGLHKDNTEPAKQEEEQAKQVEMIAVEGKPLDEVKRALIELGLTPEIEYEVTEAYEEGIVMKASVKAGQKVDINTNVILTVAEGSDAVAVPSVLGKSQAEATSMLEKAGFVVNVTQSYDAVVQSGYVIAQSPEAEKTAPPGSSITIRVSQGAEITKVQVPNVVGMEETDAIVTLTENGLTVGTVSQVNNEDVSLLDKICYQSYSVGSYVDKGTVIDLKVSIGPSAATYKYADNITAPTEDPDYRNGMNVAVTLTTVDGTQLLSTQTTTFPVGVNYTGIKSATGTIQFKFTVTTEATTTTNPETGETVTVEGTSTEKVVNREIAFTEE